MNETQTNLTVIDGETLMDMKLPPTKFCVETLLPQGISLLGGAPKIGKSWMVLDLCVRIAKGKTIWDLPTRKGTTLYLCLEDPLNRVQQRLCMLTDEVPENAYFAIAAGTLANGLCEQIRNLYRSIQIQCWLLSIHFRSCAQTTPTHPTQTITMRSGR